MVRQGRHVNDETLRALERTARESRSPSDLFAFRTACVRAGVPERAGLEHGDLVECRALDVEGAHSTSRGRVLTPDPLDVPFAHVFVWPHYKFHAAEHDGEAVVWTFNPANVTLIAPRDPTRAKRPQASRPTPSTSDNPTARTWRQRLAPVVRRTLLLTEAHGAPEEEIRLALKAAYESLLLGGTSHPLKAWRFEVRLQRGLPLHPRQDAAARKRPAGPLFDGVSP